MSDSSAYQDAALELGKSIALGAIPFLGQAIDAYDTVESAIRWYKNNNHDGEALDEAKFDFILSLIGWVPGPGDGVKKSLRLVNKDPDRYAPVLFDLLRFVLHECGIKTSPEELLAQIFNASRLSSAIGDIREAVEDSSAFDTLPESYQKGILYILDQARVEMPQVVALVGRRIARFKSHTANSSAAAHLRGTNSKPLPDAKDQKTGTKKNRSSPRKKKEVVKNDKVSKQALRAMTGVSGEHIADYICFKDNGWGHWSAHDKGVAGKWFGRQPGRNAAGKLSNGGKLFKRLDPPNGTGIDAVWRANGKNNGKPYAIVEAKASVTNLSILKRPLDELNVLSDNTRTIKNGGRVPLMVQMSHDWIRKNMNRSVGRILAQSVLDGGYARHLYYVPYPYLKIHLEAPSNAKEIVHAKHKGIHYSESEIKSVINTRKSYLLKQYPTHARTLVPE